MGYPLPGEKTLNDGLYYFAVSIDVNYISVEVSAAGEAEMSHNQSPLPSERTINGVTYQVETSLLQKTYAYVQTKLTVSNTSDENKTVTLALECPVQIVSFLDSSRRDYAYLDAGWQPDWYPGKRCELNIANVNVKPLESLEFTQDYLVRETLNESKLGRHYFAAFVWQREGTLSLSAGDLELHY